MMNSSMAYPPVSPNPSGFWPWLHIPFYPPPVGPAIYADDKPLDLSAKSQYQLPSPPQVQIRSSVIHSTKDAQYLPTCTQPEISIETPSSPPKPSPDPSPPNRMSYPREFKLMVIDYYYTNGLNKYRTCKEFQITKSMLNGWLAKADKIQQSKPGALKSGKSGRKPQFPDVEKQLYALYLERAAQGEKISNRWVRETAKNLASEQRTSGDLGGMCQFSERWLSNFKRRYGIGAEVGKNLQSDNSTVSGDEGFHRDDDEASCSSEDHPPSEAASVISSTAMMAQAILHQTGEPPIQAFYKKFPWLCRRPTVSHDLPEIPEERPSLTTTSRGRKVQFPLVEKQLYDLVLERQRAKEKVSNKWLQEKAREIAKSLPERDDAKGATFSDHWLNNFKKRFGLVHHQDIKSPIESADS